MARGIEKTGILKDDRDKAMFLEQLGKAVNEGRCFIYAWVNMSSISRVTERVEQMT